MGEKNIADPFEMHRLAVSIRSIGRVNLNPEVMGSRAIKVVVRLLIAEALS